MKKFAVVLLLAIAVLAMVVVLFGESDEGGAASKVASVPAEKLEITVAARDLALEYASNEYAAGEKYDGQWIATVGEASDIRVGMFGKVSLRLGEICTPDYRYGPHDPYCAGLNGNTVLANIADDSKEAIKGISFYDTIALVCTVQGKGILGEVVLQDCIVVGVPK